MYMLELLFQFGALSPFFATENQIFLLDEYANTKAIENKRSAEKKKNGPQTYTHHITANNPCTHSSYTIHRLLYLICFTHTSNSDSKICLPKRNISLRKKTTKRQNQTIYR